MKQCAKCGHELSDTALYCKNCGAAAISPESALQVDTEAARTGLLDLSVRLRELCDDMTATYVDAVKSLELKDAARQENIDAMTAQLDELKDKNAVQQESIHAMEAQLAELKVQNAKQRENADAMETQLAELKEKLAQMQTENARLGKELSDSSAANERLSADKKRLEQELEECRAAAGYTVRTSSEDETVTEVYYEPDNEETGHYCPNCGALVSTGALYCGNCGAKISGPDRKDISHAY